MAKRGRPFKDPKDIAQYKLIAIDINDYKKIKVHSIETNTQIKVIIHKLVENI